MTQAAPHDRLVMSDSLLRKNDLLREKNIGKHIPLPQVHNKPLLPPLSTTPSQL